MKKKEDDHGGATDGHETEGIEDECAEKEEDSGAVGMHTFEVGPQLPESQPNVFSGLGAALQLELPDPSAYSLTTSAIQALSDVYSRDLDAAIPGGDRPCARAVKRPRASECATK